MQLKETGWRPEMPPVALNAPSSERPLEAMGQREAIGTKTIGCPLTQRHAGQGQRSPPFRAYSWADRGPVLRLLVRSTKLHRLPEYRRNLRKGRH
jgi:hypothetical protein